MCRSALAGAMLAAALTTVSATYANAQEFRATLSGFEELGALNAQTGAIFSKGPVVELVGIEGGVVSGVFNLESPDVEALGRRPRHEEH